MSDTDEQTGTTRRWQLRLSSLLALILLLAVGLGWWSDRARLTDELAESQLDVEMKARQIKLLRQKYEPSLFPPYVSGKYEPDPIPEWTPDALIQSVLTDSKGLAYYQMHCELTRANEDDFNTTIELLLPLVESSNREVARRALDHLIGQLERSPSINFRMEYEPHRMKPYHGQLIEQLLPLLEKSNEDEVLVGMALQALRSMEPKPTDDIMVRIKTIMDDDSHENAVDATLTAARIDRSLSIGPRLMELIEIRHPAWHHAVSLLPEFVPKDENYPFLKKQYAEVTSDSDRDAIVVVLNEIGA